MKSEMKKIDARCENGCIWRLYGSMIQNEATFFIKICVNTHSYYRSFRNRQITSEWIAHEFLEKIILVPEFSAKEIQSVLKEKYSLTMTLQQ